MHQEMVKIMAKRSYPSFGEDPKPQDIMYCIYIQTLHNVIQAIREFRECDIKQPTVKKSVDVLALYLNNYLHIEEMPE